MAKELLQEMLREDNILESYDEKANRIRPYKKFNSKGGYSTHIMRHEQLDSGEWVAFPTLFYNKDKRSGNISWKDMSSDEDWGPAYREALKRDEVFKFSSMKDAEKFALGSWKRR